MSAFYDLASLVVVPSGYKSGKVYAQKPLTTDGQLAFTRASTATRVNASGLVEAVASGVPRLDYLNSTCPKLLLEPQRTNLALYSEQFDNAAWAKRANIGITANAIVSPDGTTNADKMAATNASVVDYGCFQIVASGLNTYSVFAKKAEMDYVFIGKDNSFASDGVFFNLNTGAISSNPSSYSATITNYGNGWYRCSVYFATNVSYFFISPSVNGTSFNFSGQSGNGIYIYGAQAEVGAYATSYIPTLGASVTRVADAASKTGISSLIGQTEGVMFVDFTINALAQFAATPIPISITNSGGTNEAFIQIFATPLGRVAAGFIAGGVLTNFINLPSYGLTNGRHKMAYAYKQNDFALYIDGVLAGSGASGNTAGCSELYIQKSPEQGFFNQFLLFKTRLTNAQLAELTSL